MAEVDEKDVDFLHKLMGIETVGVIAHAKCRNCDKYFSFPLSMNKAELLRIKGGGIVGFSSMIAYVHECVPTIYGVVDIIRFSEDIK